jgi:predicted metal-binding membrane protein
MILSGNLRRFDSLGIIACLLAIVLLAWLYLYDMAVDMEAMSLAMPHMAIQPWDISYALMMFLMWSIMMVGMMLPSATPAILIYNGIAKKASREGSSVAPTWIFTSGYLLMWVLFSILATVAQWALDSAALLSPMMVSTSSTLGATLLIVAGVYQWLPIKNACLRHCRSPIEFISSHWQAGNLGALNMGIRHGLYCLGCCWVLMSLLFLGGVMNLLWIALITLFVLVEKLLPYGDIGGRLLGLGMIAIGLLGAIVPGFIGLL